MANDLRIVDAPEIPSEEFTSEVKIPTGGKGNYSVTAEQISEFVKVNKDLTDKDYVDTSSNGVKQLLENHKNDKANPHAVTKAQIGLGNVNNTADLDKPVSNATSSAIITAGLDKATKTTVDSLTRLGGVDYWKGGEYPLNGEVRLIDGSIARSLVSNNIKNPNVDMGGWVVVTAVVVVKTVSELLLKKLRVGDVVKTIGYHNLFDNGGAMYVISDSETNYSIPLVNNLHAVFSDEFDIRKFGVVDSVLLDQSVVLTRAINYADRYCYEIDFLNFKIKNPEIYLRTTYRDSILKGMVFKNFHKIKNLFLANDKTKALYQGTCGIVVALGSNPTSIRKFEFENVHLDMHTPTSTIISGEADGFMHGIHFDQLDDSNIYTANNIDIDFNGVNFISSAQSYNISASENMFNKITVRNSGGDHLMLFSFALAKDIVYEDLNCNYRADLHIAGQSLGRTVLHLEPEEHSGNNININSVTLKNIQSTATDGQGTIPMLYHRLENSGIVSINRINVENCNGGINLYGGVNQDKIIVGKFYVDKSENISVLVGGYTETLEFYKCSLKSNAIDAYLVLNGGNKKLLIIDDCDILEPLSYYEYPDIYTCKTLKVTNSRIYSEGYGLVRGGVTPDRMILINNELRNASGRYIETACSSVQINGLTVSSENGENYSNPIYLQNAEANVSVSNVYCERVAPNSNYPFILGNAKMVTFTNSIFTASPVYVTKTGITTYSEFAIAVPPVVTPAK